MKKTFIIAALFIATLILTSSYELKDSNGKAGYTGSPGESTCGACHSGGSFTSPGVSITATPSFSNNAYLPDSVYTVSLTVNATGSSRFGFACEVLDGSNANIGTLQDPGAGVKLVNIGRVNMTHSTPKISSNSATFTFKWVAPAAGNGDAVFYTCANAVNGNGSTSGDLSIPRSYTLNEGAPPTPTVGIKEYARRTITQVSVYPNPAINSTNVSYELMVNAVVSADLRDVSGKQVKVFFAENQTAGSYNRALSLEGIPPGVYFVNVQLNNRNAIQKMLIVE